MTILTFLLDDSLRFASVVSLPANIRQNLGMSLRYWSPQKLVEFYALKFRYQTVKLNSCIQSRIPFPGLQNRVSRGCSATASTMIGHQTETVNHQNIVPPSLDIFRLKTSSPRAASINFASIVILEIMGTTDT